MMLAEAVTMPLIGPSPRELRPRTLFLRIMVAWLTLLGFWPATAQKYSLSYDPDSPAGPHLELIEATEDAKKRTELMEQFIERFPKHAALGWIYESLMHLQSAAGNHPKVIAAGTKLLDLYPTDLDAAMICLKAAETSKDPAQVKLWTERVKRIAEDVVHGPLPKDPVDRESWDRVAQTAGHLLAMGEYELYNKALQTTDLRIRVQLINELLRRNPKSEYAHQSLVLAFQAHRVLGNQSMLVETATRLLKLDGNNEDALLALADFNLRQKSDLALSYANRVLEVLRNKRKPDGIPEDFWARKKAFYSGTAHWIIGNVRFMRNQFFEADEALRAALRLLPGDEHRHAILYYLGWSNVQLQRYDEATKFYTQCAAIKGPYQADANRNIEAIRSQEALR
jgi:tetratricopeptide (TPR) repeat protein